MCRDSKQWNDPQTMESVTPNSGISDSDVQVCSANPKWNDKHPMESVTA